MSGFQPEDKGSTPLFRSEGLFGFISEVVITLACHARVRSSILLWTAKGYIKPNRKNQKPHGIFQHPSQFLFNIFTQITHKLVPLLVIKIHE